MEKIAIVFPGQGSQFVGMGERFYESYDIAKKTYEEACEVLNFNVMDLCFKGSLLKLNKNHNMQVAVFVTNVAISRVYFEEIKIPPQFCAGHSVGEYSALVAAGAVSFRDALKMIEYRGKLSNKIYAENTGSMSIVENIDLNTLKAIIPENVFISNYNSQNQFTICAENQVLEKTETELIENGAKVTPLLASPPFHSPLMGSIREDFKKYLKQFRYYPLRFPIILNISGKPFCAFEKIPDVLSDQLIKPVLWYDSVKSLEFYGVTKIIEMGPKNLVMNLIDNSIKDKSIQLYCFSQKKDRADLMKLFSGMENYKTNIPQFLPRCLAFAVSTPNRNWDKKEFTTGVIEPYENIMKIVNDLEEKNKEPDIEQMKQGLELLKKILTTKKIPAEEQENCFKQLLDETNTYYLFNNSNILSEIAV